MSALLVQPGDWAVVNTGTSTTRVITAFEWLEDRVRPQGLKWTDWDHAVVCVGATTLPGGMQDLMIVEAEPRGAQLVRWHYGDRPHQWSSGKVDWPDGKAGERIADCAARLASEHVGYGWLDYAALTTHALRIPAPGLQEFIASTNTMICSQLVDYCAQYAGVHLFNDNRWNGDVTPSDLGALLAAA